METCDISSQGRAGVAIHGSANPILRNNRIYDSKASGIYVYEQGQGLIEENEIFANANASIAISHSSTTMVRNNHIHDGQGIITVRDLRW